MRVYSPLTYLRRLNKRSDRTELDLQCDLYARLKSDKFDIRVAVPYAGEHCFDLVVFECDGTAKAIIEVKRECDGFRVALDQTEQGFNYRQFGVPVILFWDMVDYEELKTTLLSPHKKLKYAEDGTDLRIEQDKKRLVVNRLRSLAKSLDISLTTTFDAQFSLPDVIEFRELYQVLEKYKAFVDKMHRDV
jgi:hypothetical protein